MNSANASLNPQRRQADVRRLANEQFDILVIGGGVTGAGCALDAATRGLKVALVEQRDLASGTSSRSSKLLHGGLRYLEQRDFGLVREALRERGLLTQTISPHLVRTVSFMIPLTKRFWQRLYLGGGVLLYDLLARTSKNPLPFHHHLGRDAAIELAPCLKRDSLVGAIVYQDAQIDDARHTLAVARSAALHNTAIATSTQVVGLILDHCQNKKRVVGAKVRDLEDGSEYECRATATINATGVWIDDIHDLGAPSDMRIRAAKGVHIVVPKACIDSKTAIVLRTAQSVLFVIPWGDFWLLGTTDTAWSHDLAHPAASSADIDYILAEANKSLEHPLHQRDVVSVYVGLRPLLDAGKDDTTKLSREHAVAQPVDGLVSIAGGKYTTYRIMAADAVDAALGNSASKTNPSRTSEVVLVGSENWEHWSQQSEQLGQRYSLAPQTTERLLWRHGSCVLDLLAIIDEQPELKRQIAGGDYLAAEVVYAVRHEGALHLDDVLARRLRISIEDEQRGNAAAANVARLMATELNWSAQREQHEISVWYDRVEAERAANSAADDLSAAHLRQRAIDSRGLNS